MNSQPNEIIGKDQSNAPPFPVGALYAAASVIAFSLIITSLAVFMGYRMTWTPPAQPASVLAIHFEIDKNDGDIVITDALTKRQLAQMPSQTNRFVKSLAGGLDFQRTRDGHATSAPYEVVRWDDGRLSLRDPITGKQIELAAFGRNQVLIFAEIMERAHVQPQAQRRTSQNRQAAAHFSNKERAAQ